MSQKCGRTSCHERRNAEPTARSSIVITGPTSDHSVKISTPGTTNSASPASVASASTTSAATSRPNGQHPPDLADAEVGMSVEVRSDDLVEDAGVDDDTDHREHRRCGRRDRRAVRARDVTIDHEDRRQCIDRRDGAEDDERRTRHAPEALSIGPQRGTDHVPEAGAAAHELRRSDHLGHAHECRWTSSRRDDSSAGASAEMRPADESRFPFVDAAAGVRQPRAASSRTP